MSEEFQATYEYGVLRLDEPLALPDNARVRGVLTNVQADASVQESLSSDEFNRILDELAMPLGGTLPADFSREDIYIEHD